MAIGSLETLADYLVHGYWKYDNDQDSRKWGQAFCSADITRLSAAEQTAARAALAEWTRVTGFVFIFPGELLYDGLPRITFTNNAAGGAFATPPDLEDGIIQSVTVNIPSNWGGAGFARGTFGYETYIHEIGHALGLGHQGPYNSGDGRNPATVRLWDNDTTQYSVMSYNSVPGFRLWSPMLADILAIQSLYGFTQGAATGNTVYGYNATFDGYGMNNLPPGGGFGPAFTIVDSGGYDTLDGSGDTGDAVLDLNQRTFSSMGGLTNNVAIADYTVIEAAIGGAGNDRLIGNWVDNNLEGNAGNDTIFGNDGNDVASGSQGDDTLFGWIGNDILNGNENADTLHGEGDQDTLNGGDGNDTLYGGDGHDALLGGDGRDVAFGGNGDDRMDAGYDLLGPSIPSNGDQLYGEFGNDTLTAGAGDDVLDGGPDRDRADFSRSNIGVVVDLTLGKTLYGYAQGDTLVSIEDLAGSNFDDDLVGDDQDNVLLGNGGADNIDGRAGNDYIDGGDGDDVLVGGLGADRLIGGNGIDTIAFSGPSVSINLSTGVNYSPTGEFDGDVYIGIERFGGTEGIDSLTGDGNANSFFGRAGDDVLIGAGGDDKLAGGDGADTLDGGDGFDTASYTDSPNAVIIDMTIGKTGAGTGGDTFVSIEDVEGSGFGDTLIGADRSNRFFGLGGDDRLEGRGGPDILYGGDGNDRLYVGAGTDSEYAHGGAGIDTLYFEGSSLVIDLTTGIHGGAAASTTIFEVEVFNGLAGADAMTAASTSVWFYGGDGDDHLRGSSAGDTLDGGNGADWVYGFDGNDLLVGGQGTDLLSGLAGIDTVSYGGAAAGVTVSLANTYYQETGGEGQDWLYEVENLVGSVFADQLTGDALNNELNGSLGDDLLDGGLGYDTGSFVGGAVGVVASLASGFARAGDERDTLTSIERLIGTAHADTLTGDAGSNQLRGMGGRDTLVGLGGDDSLWGFADADTLRGYGGKDFLDGGVGADLLDGGAGNDRLRGGGGADTFVFLGNFGFDIVVDFANGLDLLDLAPSLTFASLALSTRDADADGLADDARVTVGASAFDLIGIDVAALDATDFLF